MDERHRVVLAKQRHVVSLGTHHRSAGEPTGVDTAPGRIPALPDYLRTVLAPVRVIRVDPLRGWTFRFGSLSRNGHRGASANVHRQSDDFQRMGSAVLHL